MPIGRAGTEDDGDGDCNGDGDHKAGGDGDRNGDSDGDGVTDGNVDRNGGDDSDGDGDRNGDSESHGDGGGGDGGGGGGDIVALEEIVMGVTADTPRGTWCMTCVRAHMVSGLLQREENSFVIRICVYM